MHVIYIQKAFVLKTSITGKFDFSYCIMKERYDPYFSTQNMRKNIYVCSYVYVCMYEFMYVNINALCSEYGY